MSEWGCRQSTLRTGKFQPNFFWQPALFHLRSYQMTLWATFFQSRSVNLLLGLVYFLTPHQSWIKIHWGFFDRQPWVMQSCIYCKIKKITSFKYIFDIPIDFNENKQFIFNSEVVTRLTVYCKKIQVIHYTETFMKPWLIPTKMEETSKSFRGEWLRDLQPGLHCIQLDNPANFCFDKSL